MIIDPKNSICLNIIIALLRLPVLSIKYLFLIGLAFSTIITFLFFTVSLNIDALFIWFFELFTFVDPKFYKGLISPESGDTISLRLTNKDILKLLTTILLVLSAVFIILKFIVNKIFKIDTEFSSREKFFIFIKIIIVVHVIGLILGYINDKFSGNDGYILLTIIHAILADGFFFLDHILKVPITSYVPQDYRAIYNVLNKIYITYQKRYSKKTAIQRRCVACGQRSILPRSSGVRPL
jgi:hypothetical protein